MDMSRLSAYRPSQLDNGIHTVRQVCNNTSVQWGMYLCFLSMSQRMAVVDE